MMVPKLDKSGFVRTPTGRVVMCTTAAADDPTLSVSIRRFVPAGDSFDFTDEMTKAAAQEWAARYPQGKPLTDTAPDRRGWIVETNEAALKLLA